MAFGSAAVDFSRMEYRENEAFLRFTIPRCEGREDADFDGDIRVDSTIPSGHRFNSVLYSFFFKAHPSELIYSTLSVSKARSVEETVGVCSIFDNKNWATGVQRNVPG